MEDSFALCMQQEACHNQLVSILHGMIGHAVHVMMSLLLLLSLCRLSSRRHSSARSRRQMAPAASTNVNLLVVASPDTPELSVLQRLPPEVKVVATGEASVG